MITMTKKVVSNYNEEKREGRWWSTWRSQLGRSLTTTSTREKRWEPPRSWPKGSWVATTKKEEEEDHDQNRNQEWLWLKAQEKYDEDHQDHN